MNIQLAHRNFFSKRIAINDGGVRSPKSALKVMNKYRQPALQLLFIITLLIHRRQSLSLVIQGLSYHLLCRGIIDICWACFSLLEQSSRGQSCGAG